MDPGPRPRRRASIVTGVSPYVLEAVARVLQLDGAERAHLLRLAQETNGGGALLHPIRKAKQRAIRPSLQWSLDNVTARRTSTSVPYGLPGGLRPVFRGGNLGGSA